MSKTFWAHIAILGANIIYGLNYTIAKGIMPDFVQPFGLVLLRVCGAASLFWIWSFFVKTEKLKQRDYIRLGVAAFFGVAVNQMLFLKGLNYTTPIDSAIIMTVNPILVLIVSAILIGERITMLKVIGIVTGAAGALLLILKGGNVDFSGEKFIGNIMIFFNALSYGVYLVVVKPLMRRYSPNTVMKWVFLLGIFYVTPFSSKQFTEIDWQIIPTDIGMAIIYVVVATTFIAYLLNIFGLKHVQPTTVSIYIYSQPVIASIVAILSGKDEITILKIGSTLLVFTGVYMVSKPTKRLHR